MRVWFNHWFSSIYPLMKLLRENNPDVTLIGSNRIETAVYRDICQEFYVEPCNLSESDYLSWCFNFCKEHQIDIFVPRGHRVVFSKNIDKFLKINTTILVCSDFELIELLEDKIKTAKYFKEKNICAVPEMFLISSIDEFKEKYNYLKMSYPNKAICMKNPEDEGGISFRVINPDLDMLNILNPNVYENLINYKSVLDVLERSPHFNNFILMPYLDGPEVSVDSIMTKDGRFICVSREKIGTRVARVYYNKELSEISKKFAEVSGITMPYNMQFRKINDKYVLLEVNTRISGGCYKDLYVGVDILGIAFKDVLDLPFIIPDYEGIVEKYISVVETPILLDI